MPTNASLNTPYFDIEALKSKGLPTAREKQEARVLNKISHFKRDISVYEKNIATIQANLDRFLSEIENCFDEGQVERVLTNAGI